VFLKKEATGPGRDVQYAFRSFQLAALGTYCPVIEKYDILI
jgi:hypothetical protein